MERRVQMPSGPLSMLPGLSSLFLSACRFHVSLYGFENGCKPV